MLVDLKAAGVDRGKNGLFKSPSNEDLMKLRGLFE